MTWLEKVEHECVTPKSSSGVKSGGKIKKKWTGLLECMWGSGGWSSPLGKPGSSEVKINSKQNSWEGDSLDILPEVTPLCRHKKKGQAYKEP